MTAVNAETNKALEDVWHWYKKVYRALSLLT